MPGQYTSGKPEIMSPAGYWPQLRAAIEAGADSVYFGLKHFTARAKVGFSLDELPEVMSTLHRRGVKGYITFNSLVFEHELREAARALASIARAGADAIIVQDAGIVKLAKAIAPELVIHGSTQMSITSAEGVEFARRLGVSRVTLARELSLEEVRQIRARTTCELEIFIHGALCVAYSGQCFSSEAWGGRSANRGQCAQACRLPYDLLVDGRQEPLGDARYLLSPGDLLALRHIPEIVKIGISALKIEGRYKDAEYVALTTSTYRKAVDEAWAGLRPSADAADELRLEQVYSRGLGPHFLEGTNHQRVVRGRAPRHRGVLVGTAVEIGPEAVVIEPAPADGIAALKPGDGLVFDAADWRSPEEPDEGGRVFEVARRRDGRVELRFGNGAIDPSRIRRGDLVWRTHDPDLRRAARPFLEAAVPVRKQPVRVRVTAHEGAPLVAEWSIEGRPGLAVAVTSEAGLAAAQNRGIDAAMVRAQFGRLGGTPYELAAVDLDTRGRPFVPSSLLNQLRREAVALLTARQSEAPAVAVHAPEAALEALVREPANRLAHAAAPELHVLVRTPDQLAAALDLRPASITLDYLDLYGLRPSVERVRASGIGVRVASPRVLKPGEERITEFLARLECPILVRSTGLLEAISGSVRELTGDFSLNAANTITARAYLETGIARITPTHDLNAAQIEALARALGGERLEAIAYQHLPVFHTEHCVFCRFLSTGTSFRDCGRPCEKHSIELRDVSGRAHPVIADVGCRNTVFGAEAQEAAAHLEAWRNAGIRYFRLEFAHESGEQVQRVVLAFDKALNGSWTADQLSRELRRIAPQGTTEGSLFVPSNYLVLPVLQ